MDRKLFIQALTKFFAGLLAFGVLLFLPAGTFRYPQGWLLTGILFVPMFAAGLVMMKNVKPHMLKSTCFLTWLLPWAALGSQTWSSADTRSL